MDARLCVLVESRLVHLQKLTRPVVRFSSLQATDLDHFDHPPGGLPSWESPRSKLIVAREVDAGRQAVAQDQNALEAFQPNWEGGGPF
jgi:hypothetical protein